MMYSLRNAIWHDCFRRSFLYQNLAKFNFQYGNLVAQGMRSSKMSDFLQIGQDLAELWPFEN